MTKHWAFLILQIIHLITTIDGVKCPPETNQTNTEELSKDDTCELGSTKYRQDDEFICCKTSKWCGHRMHSGCNYDEETKSFEYSGCDNNPNIERWFCPILAADMVKNPRDLLFSGIKECETILDCPDKQFCTEAYNEAYKGRDRSGPGGKPLKFCFQWYNYIDYFYPEPKICDTDDECFEGSCRLFVTRNITDQFGNEHKGICRFLPQYTPEIAMPNKCTAGRTAAPITDCSKTSDCYGDEYDLDNRLSKWCQIDIGKCCTEKENHPEEMITCPDGQTPLYSQPTCPTDGEKCGNDAEFSTGRCFFNRCCPQTGIIEDGNGDYKLGLAPSDNFRTNVECDTEKSLPARFEFSFCKDGYVWSMSKKMVEMETRCKLNSDCGRGQVCGNLEYGSAKKCFVNRPSTKYVDALELAFKIIIDVVKNIGF